MNRLKELRKEKKLTQQEIADEIGVTKRTYVYWEQGKHQIKSDKAKQLADYFGVSMGYLLGFTDYKCVNTYDFNNKDIIYQISEKMFSSLKQELDKRIKENFSISNQLKSVISRLKLKNLSDVERVEIRKLSLELLEETL